MSFQRARTDEQKEERRTDIMESAAALLHERGIDGASLNEIARRAGIAKSGVYKYFESREQIFMELFREDFGAFVDWAESAMAPLAGTSDVHAVAVAVARGFIERPRLCELNYALAPVLEQNVSEETVLEFKTHLMGLALRLGMAVHEVIPQVSFESLALSLGPIYALIGGLWPHANPPAAVAAVLERPEFELMRGDFERDLTRGIELMLKGLVSEC